MVRVRVGVCLRLYNRVEVSVKSSQSYRNRIVCVCLRMFFFFMQLPRDISDRFLEETYQMSLYF